MEGGQLQSPSKKSPPSLACYGSFQFPALLLPALSGALGLPPSGTLLFQPAEKSALELVVSSYLISLQHSCFSFDHRFQGCTPAFRSASIVVHALPPFKAIARKA